MTKKQVSKTAIFMVALGSMFYVYEFFLRVAPGALTHELMRDIGLNAFSLGLMNACFFYAYAPLQIPAGLLCDAIGPKRSLTGAVAICGMATILFSLSGNVWHGAITRFLTGAASSLAFIGPLALSVKWLPKKHFALAAGSVQLMGALGALFGGGPIAAISHVVGWRHTLLVVGIIGLLLMLVFKLFLQDSPVPDDKEYKFWPMVVRTWAELLEFCRNKQVWVISIASFACWAPMAIFAELWGGPFLSASYHLNAVAASSAISWVWVAIAIASPLGGWWSDKLASRCKPLAIFFFLGIISSLLLIYCHFSNLLALYAVLFIFGLTSAAQPITFGLIADIAPKNMMSTAIGFNNMCVIAGATVLQPLVGSLLQNNWHHKILDNAPYYEAANYQHAMILLPIISVVGFLAAKFFIKETNCKSSIE